MMLDYLSYAALTIVIIIFLALAIRILREYVRGIVFTLGRFTGVKGPGLIILIPVVQQMVKVDLRVMVQEVPPQHVVSRDNVSVKVNAVLYFRIIDPERAIIRVANYMAATSQLAQTTLRSVLGKHELDEMLAGLFWSLGTSVVSGGDFGGPVSASKNSVPGGQGSATDVRRLSHGSQTSAEDGGLTTGPTVDRISNHGERDVTGRTAFRRDSDHSRNAPERRVTSDLCGDAAHAGGVEGADQQDRPQ
jgi:hypothetical protein